MSPWKPKVPCGNKSCPELVDPKERFCPKHKKEDFKAFRERAHRPWHSMYQMPQWKELRDRYIAMHPTCESCGGKAEHVHHVKAFRGDIRLFLDVNNLMSLCSNCHNKGKAKKGAS